MSVVRRGKRRSSACNGNGNRTSKTLNGVTQTYLVDDGDKLLSVTQGGTTVKSYGYDAAGRTTSVVPSAGTTTVPRDRPRFRGEREDKGSQRGD